MEKIDRRKGRKNGVINYYSMVCKHCHKIFQRQAQGKKYCSNGCKHADMKGKSTWNKGKTNIYSDDTIEKMRQSKLGSVSWNAGMKMGFAFREKCRKNSIHKVGELNNNWKGGKTKHRGYVFVYNPNHPYVRPNGYVAEHRSVVESHIKRFLLPTEEVHHMGKKDDNRPNMLMAFTSHSAHIRFEYGKSVTKDEIIFDGRDHIIS